MASVPKASAAALRLSMAVPRARGGPGALYITLAGSPELGATSARSKWVLTLAAGRDQNSADLRGSCIARSPLLVSSRRSGRYNITTRAPYRYFYRPSTFRAQHGCPRTPKPAYGDHGRGADFSSNRPALGGSLSFMITASCSAARRRTAATPNPTLMTLPYETSRASCWPGQAS